MEMETELPDKSGRDVEMCVGSTTFIPDKFGRDLEICFGSTTILLKADEETAPLVALADVCASYTSKMSARHEIC